MAPNHGFPTLLLPGITGGSLSMWPLGRTLRKSGIRAEHLGLPFVLTEAVSHYAERARARIRVLHEKTGLPVTLVGLSMGGLIAVDAVAEPEAATCVRRIIAIATPFDGSYPAYAAAHWPGRLILKAPGEIVPGSSTLRRLQGIINAPGRPWDIATLNGPTFLDPLAPAPLKLVEPDLRIVGNWSHLALFGNRPLHRLIARLVRADRLGEDV